MTMIEGIWDWSVRTPMGEQRAKMDVKRANDKVVGNIEGAFGKVEFDDGVLDGNSLKFSVAVKQPMPLKLEANFTIDGDALTGTVNAKGIGQFPATGKRVS